MTDHNDNKAPVRFTAAPEVEDTEYQALSGLAVIGFLFGLASCVALVHPGLAFLAGAALLCGVAALIRIAGNPSDIVGRGWAVAAIMLAVFWGSAAIAKEVTYRQLLEAEAQPFAMLWFDLLKNGAPEKALELQTNPSRRSKLDSTLLDYYLDDEHRYESLSGFVNGPEVRALLKLGRDATVRYYDTEYVGPTEISQVYAVTYDDEGTKKSFFVVLTLKKHILADGQNVAWAIQSNHGPFVPEAFKTADDPA